MGGWERDLLVQAGIAPFCGGPKTVVDGLDDVCRGEGLDDEEAGLFGWVGGWIVLVCVLS